jgi:hypothetical protein
MRPAFLYLVQAWTADPYRQAEHDRLARGREPDLPHANATAQAPRPRAPRRCGAPHAHPPGRRQPMTEPVTAQTCGRESGCCRPKTTRPIEGRRRSAVATRAATPLRPVRTPPSCRRHPPSPAPSQRSEQSRPPTHSGKQGKPTPADHCGTYVAQWREPDGIWANIVHLP